MKILVVETPTASLRAEIDAWDVEDSSLLEKDRPIGLTPSPSYSGVAYPTLLHALSDGWELLGPPVERTTVLKMHYYEWWLKKEAKEAADA